MSQTDAVAAFVESAASELSAQGFPRMPAYVIMALTASEEGSLTSAELTEQLGVSAAAISGAVSYLSTLGFVRRIHLPGSRRHVYALSEIPWYTSTLTRRPLYEQIVGTLRSGVQGLDADSAARARIEEMADFFVFIQDRMPRLLDEWKQSRGLPPGPQYRP